MHLNVLLKVSQDREESTNNHINVNAIHNFLTQLISFLTEQLVLNV